MIGDKWAARLKDIHIISTLLTGVSTFSRNDVEITDRCDVALD